MKIKVVLRANTVYKSGESPLMLRFTHQRQTRFVALGISIKPKYWDEERGMITTEHPLRLAHCHPTNHLTLPNHKEKSLSSLLIARIIWQEFNTFADKISSVSTQFYKTPL